MAESKVRRQGALESAGLAALVLATSLPLLDLALSARGELWNPQFRPFEPSWRLLLSLAAGELALLAAFAVAWWCCARPLARRLRWRAGPAALGLALLLAAALFPVLLDESVTLDADELWPKALAWALGCGVLIFGARLARARLRSSAVAGRWGRALALALPFLLVDGYLLLAIKSGLRSGIATPAFAAAALGLSLVALLTLLWCHRPGSEPRVHVALCTLAGAILVAPALARGAWPRRALQAPAQGAGELAVPRVLLITVDTLRRDALACYGSSNLTPAFDGLARESLQFLEATSNAPWTIPSVATILTGLSPWVHDSNYGARGLKPLGEWMRAAGYATMRAGYNPVLSGELAARGFDEDRFAHHRPVPATAARRALAEIFPRLMGWELTSAEITRAASSWFASRAGRPFFAWVHYFDPHAPLRPPAEFWPAQVRGGAPGSADEQAVSPYPESGAPLSEAERELVRELYLAEVRSVDAELGVLLEDLRRSGLYDETLIVLTSDHGEEIFDHESYGHGQSLFGELLDVPLLIKLPRSSARGAIGERVASVSIVPTILELAGIPFDAEGFGGPSLVPLWSRGRAGAGARPVFSTGLAPKFGEDLIAVTHDGKRYVRSLVSGAEQIYDLATDPEERVNALGMHAAFAAEARRLLEEHTEDAEARRARLGLGSRGRTMDSRALGVLESLGYL